MKKYQILFAKDDEEFWSDNPPVKSQIAGKFETDDEYLFWQTYLAVRLLPPAMWHWILINGEQIISGAIDWGDLEIIEESIDIPDWVKEESERWGLKDYEEEN